MRKRMFLLITVITAAAFLTACNPNNGSSPTVGSTATTNSSVTTTIAATVTPAPSIEKNHVLIRNFAFDPVTLTVQVGDTVVWENKDSSIHDIVLPDAKSPSMSLNDTFSHTFDTAGTFDYICGFHPYMTGKIVVQ